MAFEQHQQKVTFSPQKSPVRTQRTLAKSVCSDAADDFLIGNTEKSVKSVTDEELYLQKKEEELRKRVSATSRSTHTPTLTYNHQQEKEIEAYERRVEAMRSRTVTQYSYSCNTDFQISSQNDNFTEHYQSATHFPGPMVEDDRKKQVFTPQQSLVCIREDQRGDDEAGNDGEGEARVSSIYRDLADMQGRERGLSAHTRGSNDTLKTPPMTGTAMPGQPGFKLPSTTKFTVNNPVKTEEKGRLEVSSQA
eukprot:1393050-Amorphochlora_amoeboformis.AAC.1